MQPSVLIVMGVSGSGKTTIAQAIVARLGWPFQEGDALHPPANVEKMRAGTPLTDADRWPWLDRIAAWIDEHRRSGSGGVVTCSALKRSYRDRLVDGPEVRIVYIDAPRALLQQRLAARHHEYMPASLLDSQLATLEPPTPDERAIVVDPTRPPAELAEQVAQQLAAAG